MMPSLALTALAESHQPTAETQTGRVVYFPVRHHSPTGARLVRQLILDQRPTHVLIEGPSDFNDRIDELLLDHQLPIAIFSYVALPDGTRRGAYYPFCDYSPEWQALKAARDVGAVTRFIDLPWADMAQDPSEIEQRYADADLRRGQYVKQVCERVGVDDFDELWDRMIEADPNITLDDYFTRCHFFCFHVRLLQAEIRLSDRRREAFMTAQVRLALSESKGPILVVTGGFHSSALYSRLNGVEGIGIDDPTEVIPSEAQENEERGIALTPYAYDRLDSLTGYSAGMPSPGFYDIAWRASHQGERFDHLPLLKQVVTMVRKRKQTASTADVIAVDTTARALAALRGRDVVWRNDLLDSVTAALVKEELEYDCESPFLEAVLEVFRGDRQGQLAADAPLPPLLRDIERRLTECGLEPQRRVENVRIDLLLEAERPKSRTLHQLRLLGVTGFQRAGGTDLTTRDGLTEIVELWRIQWSPQFNASAIEASRYGTSLKDAAAERLRERTRAVERNAEEAALILLDAAVAGLDVVAADLQSPLIAQIHADGNFQTVVKSLGHLLFLYCYDEVLGMRASAGLAAILIENFARACWLLESIGRSAGEEQSLIEGVRQLVESFERTEQLLQLSRPDFVALLHRVQHDVHQLPSLCGAAVGALWTLHEADDEAIRQKMRGFYDPEEMGDFLNGLFCLAREAAQRHPGLVQSIDEMLMTLAAEEFEVALPSLRLAFTYFTPREKHHLLTTLFQSLGIKQSPLLEKLEVDPEQAAAALAWEERVYAALEKYGLNVSSTINARIESEAEPTE